MHDTDEGYVTHCFTCYQDLKPMKDTFFYNTRGIGSNWLPCFICGKLEEDKVQADMAAFVRGKEQGEKIVALYASCSLVAKLDFRPSEPDWVQVKVGACTEHYPNLRLLSILTSPLKIINEKILLEVGGKR